MRVALPIKPDPRNSAPFGALEIEETSHGVQITLGDRTVTVSLLDFIRAAALITVSREYEKGDGE